jgi:cytochrome c-type protein NapC
MTKTRSILLIVFGLVLGLALLAAVNFGLKATSTDEFCLSCHNHDIPYSELKSSAHWKNNAGVIAHCADCHIPHELGPKMLRKLAAAKEVYGHFAGVIDTDEKYRAHREAMKASEIARLRANDSGECRNCHLVNHMDFASQSPVARKRHQNMAGKTCIDCHQGIAHTAAEEDNFDF